MGLGYILFAYFSNNPNNLAIDDSVNIKKEVVDTLSFNSKIVREYIPSFIQYDKYKLEVFINDKKVYEFRPQDNCYLENVHFDRIKNTISINECKPIEIIEGTTRRFLTLRVIDYLNRNLYTIEDSVECYDDGEGSYVSRMINFDSKDTTGIILYFYWEGFGNSSWKKGIKRPIELSGNDHEYENDEIYGVLDSTKFLINSSRAGKHTWVIYDTLRNSATIIDTHELGAYTNIMLTQFGYLKQYHDLNLKGTINFKPEGRCFYELTDLVNNKKYFVKSDKEVIPIWK